MAKQLYHRIRDDMTAITNMGQPEVDPTKLKRHPTHKHRVEQSRRGRQGAAKGQSYSRYRSYGSPGRGANGEVA